MRIQRWLAALAPEIPQAALFDVFLIGLAVFLAWEVPRISPITYRQTDALPIFLGLRALAAGNDPYALAVGAQAYRLAVGAGGPVSIDHAAQFSFHYPLPPALIYLPMSLFPSLEVAAFVTRALTAGVYLVALLHLARHYVHNARPLTITCLLLWGIGWWPFLAVILPIIQPTGIAAAALAFCLLAVGTRRWFWAGFALFFALLKPQDALPALVVLAIWGVLHAEARWRLLAGAGVIAVVPVALSLFWRPDWLVAWVSALITLPSHIAGYYQNPLAALARASGAAGILIWLLAGALVIAWLALVIWGARSASQPGQPGSEQRLRVFSRACDPQWGIAVGCALALALLPRTGGYEIAIGLIPWFYAWQWAGEIERPQQRLARGFLAALWLVCGALAYLDHGYGSGIAFGVGLLLCFAALMTTARAPALPANVKQKLSMPL